MFARKSARLVGERVRRSHEGYLGHHEDLPQGRQSRSFKETQQMAQRAKRELRVERRSRCPRQREGVRVREEDAPGQGRKEDQEDQEDQVELSFHEKS